MANNKDFIVKNAVEVGGSTKVTVGDAASAGSYSTAYDIANATYDSVSFSVSSQDTNPQDLKFNSDGTKMFVVGNTGNDVNEYSLSTAFDISTASFTRNFGLGSQDGTPLGLAFNNNGTKMYMVGNNHTVYQYSLSTGFDLSGASYDSVSYSVSSYQTTLTGIVFNSDGTKMYILSSGTGGKINEYDLSTAFDISTASYNSVTLSVNAQEYSANGICFNNDGTKLFLTGQTNDTVHQFNLSTAYDLSTASFSNITFSVSAQETGPQDVVFNNDGSKMYIIGESTDAIYQYSTGSTVTTGSFDLSTGNYFTDTPSADVEYTFSNAGDVQTVQVEVTGAQSVVGYDLANASYDSVSFSVAGQETEPNGLFFKPDGTKMFVSGKDFNDIYQYSLSTAWDLSTASYDSVSFDTSSQETSPQDLFFKDDGTIMYVIGTSYDGVNQYTLSTAWDISTASYASKQLSMSAQETSVSGLFVGDNGTKVYMVGNSGDDVNQYNLSTAWDVSTGTYTQTYTLPVAHLNPEAISFNSDGTKMFIVSRTSVDVSSYTLSTAWDISTASHNSSEDFYVNSQDTTPQGLAFGNNGTKMYMTGRGSDTIYQYSTSSSTPITITWDADIEWGGGTAPDSPAAGEKDLYTITTDDGGTTYFGVQSGDAFS
jgi:6-phosphogluconolactonase (cycloisomerase 2 family)